MASKRPEKKKTQTGAISKEDTPMKNPTKEAVFIQDPKKRRNCPLCSQNMHLYYLDFKEMFLMCENNSCDFPFGYEALQIVRDESELREQPERATKDFFVYPTIEENDLPNALDSILGSTTSCLSDCDRLSTVSTISDPDDLPLARQEMLAVKLCRQNSERRKQKDKDKELEVDLNHTKELTEKMNQLNQDPEFLLKLTKNKSWLKNLKVWEVVMGRKLIGRDKNNINLPKSKLESSKKELEISIDQSNVSGENAIVNIHIFNKDNKEESQKNSDDDQKEK